MSDRNLRTSRTQVFGDVKCGTECRVCGRDVDDGRSKVCSDYCGNILSAVMGMLNWSTVRRRVIERDNHTCQECGFDERLESRARDHIRERIEERCGEAPRGPSLDNVDDYDTVDWDEYLNKKDKWRECRSRMKARYGDPYENERKLEVDHIEPVADGGHPFDPANLQTLCEHCHRNKTARENAERGDTPSRREINESLFKYVTDGGENTHPQDPIERVKQANGDLVLDYNSRIGARPYARYVDGEWELISLTHVPTPNYGMDDPDAEGGVNTEVHTVDLEPDPDDWSEEELPEITEQPRYPHEDVDGWPGVEVIDYEDSPFEHREEIPARDEIVQEIECSSCGEEFRQYLPDSFDECPHCENELEVIEGSASSGLK